MKPICISGATGGSQQLDVLEGEHWNASHSLLSVGGVEGGVTGVNHPRGGSIVPQFRLVWTDPDCTGIVWT